ncbi:MAG TPA: hypothetical protein VLJ76_02310 [Gaiellaceae bacterium]|nr:hypothetical protein [Gaiellaceae bacterium]
MTEIRELEPGGRDEPDLDPETVADLEASDDDAGMVRGGLGSTKPGCANC